jgi:transposase-like protein
MQTVVSDAADSSHSSLFSNPNLSPVQAQAVDALAEGSAIKGLSAMQAVASGASDSSLSSLSSHFSDANLSPVQVQVVEALAEGSTISGAARQAGIHRTTIHHWIRTNADFKVAAEDAQSEYVAALTDAMRELASSALKTLHRLLESKDIPPAVQLRAALAVLNRPHFPDKGWHLPERIESASRQRIVDGLAQAKNDDNAARMIEALDAAEARAAEPAPAQPIARCAPCPCGSGRKYKRCCAA